MQLRIDYQEIVDIIETKFKIRPKFTTVDEGAFEVSYRRGNMPNIAVVCRIESVSEDIISITYDCGLAASLMIAGVVAYLDDRIPSGIDVNTAGKYINIYPQHFKQVAKVLEHFVLSDIALEENTINVTLMV